jgi:Na+/glutamate symporter
MKYSAVFLAPSAVLAFMPVGRFGAPSAAAAVFVAVGVGDGVTAGVLAATEGVSAGCVVGPASPELLVHPASASAATAPAAATLNTRRPRDRDATTRPPADRRDAAC